jgi:hypothetical protein
MPRRDALVAGLLAAILFALLWPLAHQGVDQHHDGIMLKPALDVLSGQVLFRDTFTQYGALTTYLQVVALWFQPSLLSLRLLTVAAYALTLVFLYATWRMILPRSLTVLSCGLYILFIPGYEKNWLDQYWNLLPWSSVYALMFQSIGLYALFRIIRDTHAVRWGVVLGAVCACVFWCRQPVGVIMTGCVVVTWLALQWAGWTPLNSSRRTILGGIIAGFTAINAFLLGNIVFTDALPEWWYQNFVWPVKFAESNNIVSWKQISSFFVHPWSGAGLLVLLLAAIAPGLVQRAWTGLTSRHFAVYYLCFAIGIAWQHQWVLNTLALRDGGWTSLLPAVVVLQAVACLASVFRKRTGPKTTEYYLVSALAALALGSLLQYYPIPDFWHVLWSLAPVFGLVVYVFWRCSRWPAPVLAMVLTAVFLPSFWTKILWARQALNQPLVTLSRPSVLRGMQVPPGQAQTIGRIMDLLDQVQHRRPDIPCALIGSDALFLCFTDNLTNPTPYYITWPHLAEIADNLRRWSYIKNVRPLMFFHGARWDAVNDFYHREHYVPLLYLPEQALEIAVPQELADAMGLKAYGAALEGGAAKLPLKP